MYLIIASSSIFDSFFKSDFFGKLIFISLLILSIVSWIIMINKMKFSKKVKINSVLFEKEFENKKTNFLNFDLSSFSKFFNPYLSVYLTIKHKTLEILEKNRYFSDNSENHAVYLSGNDIELLESSVSSIISNEAKVLEKNLFVLSTVITLAPFLGLLGTVWGILITFSGLQSDGLASANSVVLSGLSMALGTTVFGLVVAIPPLVGYNYLKSKIGDYLSDMELFSHNLMTTLEIQYRRVEKK